MEVPLKGDFEQTACKHEYKKGKIIKPFKNKFFKSRLNKDISLCIKCGKKRSKKWIN